MTPRHWPLAALFALLLPAGLAWAATTVHLHGHASLPTGAFKRFGKLRRLTPSQPGISW